MAKKKKAEEHENLERWLVSYADFMTLLFATFVVLYALAQTDVSNYDKLTEALEKAFAANIFDSKQSIMDSSSDSILEGRVGATNPLMLEYISQKYEQTSYEEIKEEIEKLKEEGISAVIGEKGLVIRLNDKALKFKPGTAELTKESLVAIDKIAQIIRQKFAVHYIQVEGHTDSDPISNPIFPSNWELSSARASSVVRRMINAHNFSPKIFIAVGLADSVPIVENTTIQNKAKNRRVEVIVLKNKHRALSDKDIQKILKEAKDNFKKRKSPRNNPSEAVQELIGGDRELLKNVIDLTDSYEIENKRLEQLKNGDFIYDGKKPEFMEQ